MRSILSRGTLVAALVAGLCLAAVTVPPVASADHQSFFNSNDVPIPDGPAGGTAISTTAVSGVNGPIVEVEVAMFIRHPNDADLDITVRAPDGTGVVLSTDNGGTGDNYGTTSCSGGVVGFDDDAFLSITTQTNGVPTGSFRPEGLLSSFNGKSGSAVNGNWKLEVTDDSAGNTGTIECWNLIITTPPSLSVASTPVVEGRTGARAQQFTVDLSNSTSQTVQVDYVTSDGNAIAGADYSPTFGTLTFSPGETSKTVTVFVVGDTVVEGNEAYIFTLSDPVNATIGLGAAFGPITDDEAAPVVDLTSPSGTVANPVSVDATITDDHLGSWQVFADGEEVGSGSTSTIDVDLPALEDGGHNIRVVATDAADNPTVLVNHIVVDSTAPTLDIGSPAPNQFAGSPVSFRANITDGTAVHWKVAIDNVTKATGTTKGTNAIGESIPTNVGLHTAKFTVTDAAGNQIIKTRTFTVDNTAPVVTLKTPGNGATVASPVHIRADITDANGITWTLFVDDDPIATHTTKGVNAVNETVPLAAGPHTLTVRATDAAKHVTMRSRGFIVS